MRFWVGMLGTALALAACSPSHALPPEHNALAKRLQPRPQRALIYLHGDTQRHERGAGTLLLASANAPASEGLALGQPPGPGIAKLKVFNDTFSLIDAPEGVVQVALAAADGTADGAAPSATPGAIRVASGPLAISVAPGHKYYVRVNGTGRTDNASPDEASPFTVESVPEGERAIAPALLGGYVRLNDAETPPTVQREP